MGRLALWREARRRERASIEAEARSLLVGMGRGAVLRVLAERARAANDDPKMTRRLAAVRQMVIRLTPPKADTATRMLYRDL